MKKLTSMYMIIKDIFIIIYFFCFMLLYLKFLFNTTLCLKTVLDSLMRPNIRRRLEK
uniref:Uncharacterized protein n=1 Tax=Meloidogyne enterolobii TaxID=390850 RepID=A0A6V7WSC6_MELEN|nr:unnamed protein product [Meloidogyne enterolobii]